MDKTKIRKIGAVALAVLGILIFTAYSIHLILFSLSPWSECKSFAFGLEMLVFLFSLPVVISLFLLAYLIHPSKFEKFSTILKILFVLLAIGGFGVPALLIASAIINNFSEVFSEVNSFPITIIAEFSPFWIMGILAIFVFKKGKFEKLKKEYKLLILAILTISIMVIAITVWFIMSDLSLLTC